MGVQVKHHVIILFADELRIAGKACAAVRATWDRKESTDSEKTQAMQDMYSACMTALYHLDDGADDAHVLVSAGPIYPKAMATHPPEATP